MACFAAPFLFVVLASCGFNTNVDVTVGPFDYEVSATRITVPDAFRDDATMRVRQVPCMDDTSCPQLEGGEPMVRCVSGSCDPDPFVFELSTNVIDLDDNALVRRYGDRITRVEVRNATFTASANGLENTVGPTEIFWGPDSAATIDAAGVSLLGEIPALTLSAAGQTIDGTITLNRPGAAALSDHIIHVSHRFRLFARPRVDLQPGGPLPSGSVHLQVRIAVHIEGQLVR